MSGVPLPLVTDASPHAGEGKRGPAGLRTLIILSVCMALQLVSYVMIGPLFARRFAEFGADVGALATSAMAYALAATVAAPFMGALADRLGRRPLILGSLAIYVLAFISYRFAPSALALILARLVAGAFTAGLIPAASGMVADLAPSDRRAQWMGILNGSSAAGWVLGPLLGGLLYDRWGYDLALTVSIIAGGITFVLALAALPETRPMRLEGPPALASASARMTPLERLRELRLSLPVQLPTFVILLGVAFAPMLAWALMEPQFMYYAYGDLGWSSSMLGAAMSTFGFTFMLSEFALSGLGDRWGRGPVIVVGLTLFGAQFLGLALLRPFAWIAVAFAISGLGNGLYDPALNAALLDIAPADHRARVMGLRSMASSLGSILGPAVVVLFAPALGPRAVFILAAAIVAALLGLLVAARTLRSAKVVSSTRLRT